jgi:hypothetical protein
MNRNFHQMQVLVAKDEKTQFLGDILPYHNSKDWDHFQRRKQQRAVNNDMIKIALAYGRKKFIYGAVTFTLTDRNLSDSPYTKFDDMLRGLRVVCQVAPPNPIIITTYWDYKVKQKVRR